MSHQHPTSDLIDQLPVDQSPVSQEEIDIVETIFKKQNAKKVSILAQEFKDGIIVASIILVILLFREKIEQLLCTSCPKLFVTPFLVHLAVALIGGFVFYFSKNFHKLRKNN